MICLGSGGRLSRRTEAGSSLMWTNNVALVFELECKVFLSWILIPLQRPWGVPKLLAEIDSFGGCQAWFQPGLERSWNAILQFASYRIEEKEFDNLSSECKLIQFRFIVRAENKMAASLAIDGFS
ncbi:hypothetical protein V6N13_016756 [Hibiscus sabdariffa]